MEILKSAPQAPHTNAHCERIIGSIRREALDHVLITNEAHARHVLAAYERHYNEHRPHQARCQLPPDTHEQPAAVYDLHIERHSIEQLTAQIDELNKRLTRLVERHAPPRSCSCRWASARTAPSRS